MSKILFIYSLMIISWGSIYAQDKNTNIVDINLSSTPDTSNKNNYTILININIKDGWHLNSNKPLDEYMTPTSVRILDSTHIKVLNIEYPPEMIAKLQFSDADLSLYEGMVTIKVIILTDDIYIKDNKRVELELEYQSCNNQTCLFPVQKILSVNL
ncbi:MAG: protein-disulfide reductase DsbD family protein [Ignavibacteriaceae bacterium]|nr:protein-disulfide reductase DsbD family protein [Ignavibacteriaceae bacterium]